MSIINVKTEVGIEKINLDTIDFKAYEELLSRISVDTGLPNDAKTLLYSGNINVYDNKISTLDVVKDIDGVRLIRNTDLGGFVESKEVLEISV